MEHIELVGYILDCKAENITSVRKYLDDKGFDGYYNKYDYADESLRIVGDIPCDNKEGCIDKFIDFLENNGMCYFGTWE